MSAPIGEAWVCIDCRTARENGDTGDTDRTPWGLMPETDVSNWESCAGEECSDEECECGHHSFSCTPCDACGSALGGDRFRYAIWSDQP